MQIPILSGIYAGKDPELRVSYPVNLVPTPRQSGISNGFLRPADGLVLECVGPGIDRGGINWHGICYRVMGTKLVRISESNSVVILGDVGGQAHSFVTMDYSFDRLAIVSDGKLYYWNETTGLIQVTDPDLGEVLDVAWVDGYFMTTDGDSLIVTELTDPTQVNPLKYGSSEADPDPIVALVKLRNEIYALNSNTIEVFDNIGGDFFPFQRIDGAQIQKGVVGTHACCVFIETVAFVGGGRNEALGVYLGANASANKISTQEIDLLLLQYSETQLSGVKLESRNDNGHQHLYLHLPDRTMVYDAVSSGIFEEHVWFALTSSAAGFSRYRARNFVWAYGKWIVGDTDSPNLGRATKDLSNHWGQIVRWEFGTLIVYNDGKGAIFNELELVAMAGYTLLGLNPVIGTSYSLDGLNWSQEKIIQVGSTGNTKKRLAWFQQGHMRHWRIQRFRGDSQANLSFVRLEAQLEPLMN